ncbi:hypothetical protein C8R46DRAFT_1346434 [Mycena filopes]|nr:hypothetical protein C8R46DRAFT_1346434 [Mycena filopes]
MEPEREILPALGAFVVFRIDPFASLGPELLEDPETLAACKSLVNNQYVALAEREGYYKPGAPYNECTLEFVLQGEPKSSSRKFIDASMSVPIVPMATDTHPSGRIPLKPSTPLPWNDCYITCLFSALVRSPTLFTTEPVDWILDSKESSRHYRFIFSDIRDSKFFAAKAAAEKIATATISAPTDGAAVEEALRAGEVCSARSSISTKPRSRSSSRSGADSTGSGFYASSSRDLDAAGSTYNINEDTHAIEELKASDELKILEQMLSKMKPYAPQGMITVNFSHDLSAVTELNEPEEYFKEADAIARIREEGTRRIAESKARVMRLALAQDTARYDARTFDLLKSRAAAIPTLSATNHESDATPAPGLTALSTGTVVSAETPNTTAGAVPSIHSLAQDLADSKEPVEVASLTTSTITMRPMARISSRVKKGGASIVRYIRRLFCA